jgi:hypothetical protein
MFGFVILTSRNGQQIDPALIARILRDGPPYLPFEPDRAVRWQNQSGTVVVLGWEAFAEIGGIGSHWYSRPDGGLTAFAGYCWPISSGWTLPGRPWAEQLDGWLGEREPARAIDELFGQFDLIRLDAEGRGAVVTDFMSCGPLFTVELEACTLLSNRTGLLALAATPDGRQPVRSPLGVGWLVFDSFIASDETAYLDVEHVSHGAWIRIDPDCGAETMLPVRTPYEARPPHDLPQTYEELVPLMAVEIRTLLRYLASLPVDPIELRLSGGKDSRLLAAGIVATGLQDRFRIKLIGAPDAPDPKVAAQIATELGLHWELDDRRARPAEQDLAMVATHTFLTEGMLSGWNTTSLLHPRNDLTLTGVGGDYVGWRYESVEGIDATTREAVIDQFAGRTDFDPYRLLLPEARAWYLDGVTEWMDQRLARGLEPQLMRALILRETKMRGGAGIASAVEPRMWIDGYSSPIWFRASFQLPLEQRAGFRFHVDILQELCPQMLDYPLANTVWSSESYRHRPDADRFSAMHAVRGGGPETRHWRVVNWETYRPVLQAQLLDRTNPLYQVVDVRRVERLLARTSVDAGHLRYLYGALTAAIWLDERENRQRIARPVAAVPAGSTMTEK